MPAPIDPNSIFEFFPTDSGTSVVSRLESDDFDELIAVIESWERRIDQLSPGQFRGTVWLVETGGLLFLNAISNQSLQIKGRSKAGCFAFTPVHSGNLQSRFRTNQLPPGHVNILNPDDQVNHVSACGFQTSQIEIPAAIVQQIGRECLDLDASNLLAHSMSVAIGQETCDYFNTALCAELERLNANPDSFSPDVLLRLAAEIVCAVLQNTDPDLPPIEPCPRRAAFHQAVAIMNSDLGTRTTLPGICETLEISERTLTTLFQDFAGQSPKRYLRVLRFNQIRRDLKKSGTTDWIHEIARAWGIEYSGVFAAEYQKQFGELPSVTARRSAQTNRVQSSHECDYSK